MTAGSSVSRDPTQKKFFSLDKLILHNTTKNSSSYIKFKLFKYWFVIVNLWVRRSARYQPAQVHQIRKTRGYQHTLKPQMGLVLRRNLRAGLLPLFGVQAQWKRVSTPSVPWRCFPDIWGSLYSVHRNWCQRFRNRKSHNSFSRKRNGAVWCRAIHGRVMKRLFSLSCHRRLGHRWGTVQRSPLSQQLFVKFLSLKLQFCSHCKAVLRLRFLIGLCN